MSREVERCSNPFRKRRCGNTDILLYIVKDGEKHPICRECWKKISEGKWKDAEWEDKTMESKNDES